MLAGRKVDYSKTVEKNPWMKKKWLSDQYNKNIAGNHAKNLEALQESIGQIRSILCPAGSSRNVKRQSLACSSLVALEEGAFPKVPTELLPTAPRQIEIAKTAELVSEKEFAELATRNKLSGVLSWWKEKAVMSLSDVRTKMLGYKPLEPTSPRLRPGSGGAVMKVAGEVGGVLWVGGVVHAFVTNTSALDRAAAVTAIIPFVGCAVGTAAAVENKQNTAIVAIDAALCIIGDTLIMAGFAPVGFLAHLARIVVQLFTPPPEPPTKEQGLQARDDLWKQFLHEKVYNFIYSNKYDNPQQSFAMKLNNTLAVGAMAVLSEAAQSIGALNASSEVLGSDLGADLELDPVKLETGSREAIEKIREASSANVIRIQRKILLDIPATFNDGAALSLKEAGEKFNNEFIENFKSQKMIEVYSEPKWKQFLQQLFAGPFTGPVDAYQYARTHLVAVGDYIKTVPVAMPRLFDAAFILGQSKGLAHIDNEVLSGRDYIKQEVKGPSGEHVPDTYIDTLAIRHAIDVVRLIAGSLKEEELSDIFPVQDAKARQSLQLLFTMKAGK